MAYRPFANLKTVSSSSDYLAIKKIHCVNIGKNNYANSSSKLLLQSKKKNICIPTILQLCDEAPITLIDGKTSYKCDINMAPEHKCINLPRILYPYGYYLCAKTNCSTCTNVAAL
jgi:hypothetical protein